ncbi:unnamed protein product [Pedinophyceae sp. YPF-701]|nr:unnamed protein product [Pedinophyceae sp. YPF-701]
MALSSAASAARRTTACLAGRRICAGAQGVLDAAVQREQGVWDEGAKCGPAGAVAAASPGAQLPVRAGEGATLACLGRQSRMMSSSLSGVRRDGPPGAGALGPFTRGYVQSAAFATNAEEGWHWASGTPQPASRRADEQEEFQLPASLESLFAGPAHSLETPKPPLDLTASQQAAAQRSVLVRIAHAISRFNSDEQARMRACRSLHWALVHQALDKHLYDAFGLPYIFRYQHPMLCLHMWMFVRRLAVDEEAKPWVEDIYGIFNRDIESRTADWGVKFRFDHWLKEQEKNFYGAGYDYDMALGPASRPPFDGPYEGRDAMHKALWKWVMVRDGDPRKAHALERYVMHQLHCLFATPMDAIKEGRVWFSRSGLPLKPFAPDAEMMGLNMRDEKQTRRMMDERADMERNEHLTLFASVLRDESPAAAEKAVQRARGDAEPTF